MSRRERIVFVPALVANFIGVVGCPVLFHLQYYTAGFLTFLATCLSVAYTYNVVDKKFKFFAQTRGKS